jgi:hypothetical protein
LYYIHVLSGNVMLRRKDAFREIEGGELQMSYSVILAGKLRNSSIKT